MINDSWLEKLSFALREASNKCFTGNIIITFYNGGVAKITKENKEELKLI